MNKNRKRKRSHNRLKKVNDYKKNKKMKYVEIRLKKQDYFTFASLISGFRYYFYFLLINQNLDFSFLASKSS